MFSSKSKSFGIESFKNVIIFFFSLFYFLSNARKLFAARWRDFTCFSPKSKTSNNGKRHFVRDVGFVVFRRYVNYKSVFVAIVTNDIIVHVHENSAKTGKNVNYSTR